MDVLLKNNWFGPDGVTYRRSVPANAPVKVPDELRSKLPKSARVVGGEVVSRDPIPVPEPVRPFTVGAVAAKAVADANAEAQRVEKAAEVARALAAEEAAKTKGKSAPVKV